MDARARAALERIAADPSLRHSVTDLAKVAGLSPSRFAHLFAQETGAAVIDTVIRTRLAQAERLLALSSASVSEIAFAVGFFKRQLVLASLFAPVRTQPKKLPFRRYSATAVSRDTTWDNSTRPFRR